MKILLAPLHKIAKITEDSKEVLATISLLTTDLKNIALFSAKELAKHTVLLTNIRDLIKEQTSKKEKTEKDGSTTAPEVNAQLDMQASDTLAGSAQSLH